MIIQAISDTHMQHIQAVKPQNADILIHCGDFTHTGGELDHNRFMKWYGSIPATKRYALPGNHDLQFTGGVNWYTKEAGESSTYPPLMDRRVDPATEGVTMLPPLGITEEEDYIILSVAYTPHINDYWGFYTPSVTEARVMYEDFARRIEKVQFGDKKVIFVSHGPMSGANDTLERSGKRVGCIEQAEAFRKGLLPAFDLYLCGHIHEGAGPILEGEYENMHNVAFCDRFNHPVKGRGFVRFNL